MTGLVTGAESFLIVVCCCFFVGGHVWTLESSKSWLSDALETPVKINSRSEESIQHACRRLSTPPTHPPDDGQSGCSQSICRQAVRQRISELRRLGGRQYEEAARSNIYPPPC